MPNPQAEKQHRVPVQHMWREGRRAMNLLNEERKWEVDKVRLEPTVEKQQRLSASSEFRHLEGAVWP